MELNNLLNFVNNASSNIKEALDKAPKGRRNVTVKKFAEKRVKRLDSGRKPRAGSGLATSTKTSFGQRKPVSHARLSVSNTATQYNTSLKHANTWPEINVTPVSTLPVQTAGMSTCAYPTTASSTIFSNSETNLRMSFSPSQPSQTIDPELESLLSEFECQSAPLSRCGSFESPLRGNSSCTPPLNTLEAQVYVAEQAFSPYSDYSDELDSAYCSPVESTRVSCNCSPTNLGTTLPDWSSADLLPPVSSSCLQEAGMMSSSCDWVSCGTSPLTYTSTTSSVSSVYDQCPLPMTSAPSVYDQGPPMTPTVSQLLEQYNPYPYC